MRNRFYLGVLFASLMILPNVLQAQRNRKEFSKDIGIQLYSARSLIGSNVNPRAGYTDYFSVLEKLEKMAYTGVEATVYKDDGTLYNSTPEDFKRNVEKAGMKVWSSHVGKTLNKEELDSGDFSTSLAWWDKCIATHKAARVTYIVTPWLDVPKTVKNLKTQCDYLNTIGKKMQGTWHPVWLS